jgi:hypothetical protein
MSARGGLSFSMVVYSSGVDGRSKMNQSTPR